MNYCFSDPVRDAEKYYFDRDEDLKNYPICSVCGESIGLSEYVYDFDGELVCEDCIDDYIRGFRKSSESYRFEKAC